MVLSFGIITTLGLLSKKLLERVKLPGLLGMLLAGALIGPHALNWITPDVIDISGDLRRIALIVILLRAGLGIKKETLKRIGVPAFKMSCIPGVLEGTVILITAMLLLDFSLPEAGMLGFIIAAVSPAVVVPLMLNLIEQGRGQKKCIPALILTGASVDDVFAITIFSSFLGMYGGNHSNIITKIIGVPGSIFLGIVLGIIISYLLLTVFKTFHIRDTEKALILLSAAFFLVVLEDILKGRVPVASLLGVMTIGFIIHENHSELAKKLSVKLDNVWVFAEILLFVLVGAEVDMQVALGSGAIGLLIIIIGLIGRSIGVFISVAGIGYTFKEKLFCVFAYTPKATVQAAMGGVPLVIGVASGDVILAIAVLSIIVTSPIGALLIKFGGDKFLSSNSTTLQ